MNGSQMTMNGHPLPRIVCLCGSTRFGEAFREANLRETLKGRIVLTIGCDTRSDLDLFGDAGITALSDDAGENARRAAGIKAELDELHLRKIDLADEILVLNVGGYIGKSTSREVAYAVETGKPVRYLEPI